MAVHKVLLVIVAVHLVHCSVENEIDDYIPPVSSEPAWVYKCISANGCQRSNRPVPTIGNFSMVFESMDLCRTVCGRFGGIWPKPVSAVLSAQTTKIHPSHLRYDLTNVPAEARDMIAKMTQVTSENLLAECNGNVTEVVNTPIVVYLTVRTSKLELTWETDEEYFLDIQMKDNNIAVHVDAENVYGARHALETFTHLVSSDKRDHDHTCGLRIIIGAKIRDKPAYRHRGLVLDTSRHFIPMENIKKTIDGMAATKMNVFHWHVVDSHSFPLESSRVPQMTRYGAYSPSEIYSTKEVADLIKYAQIRGVRVMIEIDSPAHAGNGWQWGPDYGFGDLAVCVNSEPWRRLCIQPPCGQLNPGNAYMYKVMRNLYKDLAEALPKPPLFHIGGDEVFFGCWNASDPVLRYMEENHYDRTLEGFIQLWGEFHSKTLNIWDEETANVGVTEPQPVMIWSSELTQAHRVQRFLSKDRYVIEVWEPVSSTLLQDLIRLGYRTVSVPKDIWYLDHGFWGTTRYSNWRRMYMHQLPRDDTMYGGEVAMWTEYVDDSNIDPRIWPRAAAVAERLWSNPVSTAAAAEPRLQRLRSRLQARGLRPDAMSPAWCAQNDGRCLKTIDSSPPRAEAVVAVVELYSNSHSVVNGFKREVSALTQCHLLGAFSAVEDVFKITPIRYEYMSTYARLKLWKEKYPTDSSVEQLERLYVT